MTTFKPSEFAVTMRAARLGYGKARFGWVRICEDNSGKGVVVADIVPLSGPIPSEGPKKHYVWWEQPDPFQLSPFLKSLRNVKKRITVIIGDDGNVVEHLR